MASSSTTPGNSSGSSSMMMIQNSGSEGDLTKLTTMEQKKRKRMVSNRESARRSRMRKQKHLDDLMAKTGELRTETNQILASVNTTTQLYMNIEAENSILRAQMVELSQRLQSLNEIVEYVNSFNCLVETEDSSQMMMMNTFNPNPNNYNYNNSMFMNQSILATSSDLFMY